MKMEIVACGEAKTTPKRELPLVPKANRRLNAAVRQQQCGGSKSTETKKNLAHSLQKKFDKIHPSPSCSLEYKTPHQLMVATQLSAQCTDARVNIVVKNLFEKYPDVHAFANADQDELAQNIRSTGFYRVKAKNIIASSRRLLDEYGGIIPDNIDDLLTLAGVGRKTANLLLGELYGQPAIVVDTHVGRLSRRIGLTTETDPTKIEYALKKILPPETSLRFCHQLVHHGRMRCTARKPKCNECEIREICSNTDLH